MGIFSRLKQLSFLKDKGISVIVSCQDDHLTLRECVESFLFLGDEIIIVTNRATNKTYNLAKELASQHKVVKHIDAKGAADLSQNRQCGLEYSSYRWVFRCDADYVAYDDLDGEKSVSVFRDRILKTNSWYPTAFYITKPALSMGWSKMYEPENAPPRLKYIPVVYNRNSEPRIYSQNPFLKFTRLGRWEGVPHIRFYRKIHVKQIFWFEVTIRSPRSLFLRQARTDWREMGDYIEYPELEDYVEKVFIPKYYPGLSLDDASNKYVQEEVMPYIKEYDEDSYFSLPKRIKDKL